MVSADGKLKTAKDNASLSYSALKDANGRFAEAEKALRNMRGQVRRYTKEAAQFKVALRVAEVKVAELNKDLAKCEEDIVDCDHNKEKNMMCDFETVNKRHEEAVKNAADLAAFEAKSKQARNDEYNKHLTAVKSCAEQAEDFRKQQEEFAAKEKEREEDLSKRQSELETREGHRAKSDQLVAWVLSFIAVAIVSIPIYLNWERQQPVPVVQGGGDLRVSGGTPTSPGGRNLGTLTFNRGAQGEGEPIDLAARMEPADNRHRAADADRPESVTPSVAERRKSMRVAGQTPR